MNLQNQLEKAIELASIYHAGQKDKAGNPYILHPLWIMSNVEGISCKIVAVLHDILEDTNITERELIYHGFDKDIIESVKVLTKEKGINYMDYIKLINEYYLARKVKLVDLEHNMDLSRMEAITREDIIRSEKYKKAYNYLMENK